jgi:hypothetical protein
MHTTVRIDKTGTSNTMLQTRDHIVIMIYSTLLYFSVMLALFPSALYSMLGWFLVWANWRSFNIYCHKRAAGEYD